MLDSVHGIMYQIASREMELTQQVLIPAAKAANVRLKRPAEMRWMKVCGLNPSSRAFLLVSLGQPLPPNAAGMAVLSAGPGW